MKIWRSMLYVPANVPRFVAKAPGCGADAVILDLEDSVPAERKEEARAALATAVALVRAGGPEVLVRVNRPLETAVPDILAARAAGAQGILLTKVLGPDHVVLAAELLAGSGMWIVPMIETAAALAQAHAIARAHPTIAGMLIGAEDLAAECGAASDDELMVLAKRQMLLACVAARATRSGSLKSATVPVLNEGYSPSVAEVDLARRQLRAAEAAAQEGRGSFTVDGRMVDEPILIRARRVLAQSRAQ